MRSKILYIFKQLEWFIPILLVNAIALLGFFMYLPRSIVYYEYAFVLLALIFTIKPRTSFIIFMLLLLLDIIDVISNIYLFSLSELLASFKFLAYYKFNWQQLLYVFILVMYLGIIYFILRKYQAKIHQRKKTFFTYVILFYTSLLVLDIINGSSKLNEKNDTLTFTQKNITSSLLKNYWDQVYQSLTNPVEVAMYKEPSITFKAFKQDTSGNQLLILIESWGLINNKDNQLAIQSTLSNLVIAKGYKFSWGTSKFAGSTASGELKQLLSMKGNYKYFLHHKSDTNNILSIFDYKNKQGYATFGFHSYSENMFNRAIWWKHIGIQKRYFKENYFKENLNAAVNMYAGTPFPSVNDMVMFDYMEHKTNEVLNRNATQKIFSYVLTENAHLPFKNKVTENFPSNNIIINNFPISEEAKNQLKFIKNLVGEFIQKIDTNKWQKVLIMGDHNPPYLNKKDRNFYSDKMVPYILIYK
jgi:hypothetical protein